MCRWQALDHWTKPLRSENILSWNRQSLTGVTMADSQDSILPPTGVAKLNNSQHRWTSELERKNWVYKKGWQDVIITWMLEARTPLEVFLSVFPPRNRMFWRQHHPVTDATRGSAPSALWVLWCPLQLAVPAGPWPCHLDNLTLLKGQASPGLGWGCREVFEDVERMQVSLVAVFLRSRELRYIRILFLQPKTTI